MTKAEKKVSINFDEYKDEFFEFAAELLQTAEDGILRLESEKDNSELVDDVFRSIHSLKGEAAFMQFTLMKDLAHAMEDLMLVIKNKVIVPEAEVCDQLFKALDILSNIVREFKEQGHSNLEIDSMCSALRAFASDNSKQALDDDFDDGSESPEEQDDQHITEMTPSEESQEENLAEDEEELSRQILTVELENVQYGIHVEHVQGINRPLKVHFMPYTEDYIVGVVNMRGEVLPLIDLGLRLGLTPVSGRERKIVIIDQDQKRIGLLVDKVHSIHNTLGLERFPVLDMFGEEAQSMVSETVKSGESIIHILQTENLINRDTSPQAN